MDEAAHQIECRVRRAMGRAAPFNEHTFECGLGAGAGAGAPSTMDIGGSAW
jgi:hypothetical protein